MRYFYFRDGDPPVMVHFGYADHQFTIDKTLNLLYHPLCQPDQAF